MMFHVLRRYRICAKGNVLEQYQAPDRYWDGERHTYFAFADGTAAFKDDGGYGERNCNYSTSWAVNGIAAIQTLMNWTSTEISQNEAAAIMAKYPRIQLDWKPLMDYPLDESGLTLGELSEREGCPALRRRAAPDLQGLSQQAGFLLYPLPDHGHQRRRGKGSSAQRRR